MFQVDAGADSIAKQCRGLIAKYREEVDKSGLSDSAHEHHSGVCSGLETFLQSVVSIRASDWLRLVTLAFDWSIVITLPEY